MKKLNYVDPDAALEILGKSILGVPTTHIVEVLDNYLSAHGFKKYWDTLLKHNKTIKGFEFYDKKAIDLRFVLKAKESVIEKFFKLGNKQKPPRWELDTLLPDTQGLERPKEDWRCLLNLCIFITEGAKWSIVVPLQTLLKNYPVIKNAHYGYAHSIWLKNQNTEHYYAGITKRSWLIRMKEHLSEAFKKESKKKFHRAWREYVDDEDVVFKSELVVTNHSYEQIMSWEEWVVDKYMDAGVSLNMIPGGFKGIKFLHEHRMLDNTKHVSIDERDKAITRYAHKHPKAGIPNLLIAELWEDDDYATAVICGVDGRLSVDQVRLIRKLNHQGLSDEEIVDKAQAKNLQQVQNVLSGKTYSRIK